MTGKVGCTAAIGILIGAILVLLVQAFVVGGLLVLASNILLHTTFGPVEAFAVGIVVAVVVGLLRG